MTFLSVRLESTSTRYILISNIETFFPTSNFNGFLYQNQIDKSIRKVFDLIIPLTQRCMYPAN